MHKFPSEKEKLAIEISCTPKYAAMQCEDCLHQTVCMHKVDFGKISKQHPTTLHPFTTTITCICYRQEQPQARSLLYDQPLK